MASNPSVQTVTSIRSSASMGLRSASMIVKPALRQIAAQESLSRAMRRVDSLLRTLNKAALPKFSKQSSMQWAFGLTGQAGSCMYMAPVSGSGRPAGQGLWAAVGGRARLCFGG